MNVGEGGNKTTAPLIRNDRAACSGIAGPQVFFTFGDRGNYRQTLLYQLPDHQGMLRETGRGRLALVLCLHLRPRLLLLRPLPEFSAGNMESVFDLCAAKNVTL